MEMFNEALINAEIEKQTKAATRKAKAQYIKELVAAGIDKQLATVMANVEFEYGIVKAM